MLKTKAEIENWLNKFHIRNYIIHDNLVVDVNDNVNLHHNDLGQFPVQFGIVNGNFWAFANKLTTLKGSPYEVIGSFHCALNQLTSLDHCPKIIGKSFNCLMNPLTSLKGFNSIIENQFMHSYYVNNPFEIIELKDYYSYCEDDNHKTPYMRVDIDGKSLISIVAYNELKDTISNTYQTVVKKVKV